jgi:hypothetical protein
MACSIPKILEQVTYTSFAAPQIGAGEVFKIIQDSTHNNRSRDITGVLVFLEGQFLQVLEGCPNEVGQLVGRIQNDAQHHSMKVVRQKLVTEREYPAWHMTRVALDSVKADLGPYL